MKNWLLKIVILCIPFSSFAQVDSTTPPYKKFPTVPPIQILLGDSVTKYTKENLPKKKPVLIMLFSPECSHCQHEAEEMQAQKELLRKIQIVLITFHPLWQMNEFVSKYKLDHLPNVVVGKDIYLTLPSFYAIHNLPLHAMYNKKGKLISVVEGSMDISKVLETLQQ